MKRLPAHWLLLIPGLLVLLALFIVPIGRLAVLSVLPQGIEQGASFSEYMRFFTDSRYLGVLARTVQIGAVVSLGCLVLGYCMAYGAVRGNARWRTTLLLMAITPLLISAVVRSFGWMVLLGRRGLVNEALMTLGIIDRPLALLHTPTGVVIALTHVLLPFMVLILFSALEGIDPRLEEAAANLGASPIKVFFLVTFPLSLPGVLAGTLLVFSMSISTFITPALVGGPRVQVMATEIYDQTIHLLNWPFAGAISVILLVTVLAVMALYSRAVGRSQRSALEGGVAR